jgi:bacillithiol biosynthesis cysteine-adding enzyme BshC
MEIKGYPYDKIRQFSKRDIAYQISTQVFADFIQYKPEIDSFEHAIADRKKFPVDRALLHSVITDAYAEAGLADHQKRNLQALLSDNCYTVITAHQPSLLTGPLYFIYKIFSAINLAERLNKKFPDQHIVPIFVIGGEDHDFEEINHLRLFNKKIEWLHKHDDEPVGRLSVSGIAEVLTQVKEILGEKSKAYELVQSWEKLAAGSTSYSDFTFQLVNELFKSYGVLVVAMDKKPFKNKFQHIIQQEILLSASKAIVEKTQSAIEQKSFKAQTYIREINFFYFHEGKRKRIELEGDIYKIVDTDRAFSTEEMKLEIENHPENFSPNVIMRPLYQEIIFPNLAYVGGGGELAYWLERKEQFAHFDVFYPVLMRRNSAQLIDKKSIEQMKALGLSEAALFNEQHQTTTSFLKKDSDAAFELIEEKETLQSFYDALTKKVSKLDPTLEKRIQAESAKATKSIEGLESRLKKKIKESSESDIRRIEKVYKTLFPHDSLQERKTNFLEFYSRYGEELMEVLKENLDPFNKDFLSIVME